jgi:hypothetical protein
MIRKLIISALFIFAVPLLQGVEKKWWQSWDNFPKVPKITAAQAKMLITGGEKAVLVYSGYKVQSIVCGSLVIPYNLVPPSADGSRLNLTSIPKDYWILVYCT